MPRVIVVHEFYGCDSGCCGHVVEIDGKRVGSFAFDHPLGDDVRDFVRRVVTEKAGAKHVADIDFDNCIVVDD